MSLQLKQIKNDEKSDDKRNFLEVDTTHLKQYSVKKGYSILGGRLVFEVVPDEKKEDNKDSNKKQLALKFVSLELDGKKYTSEKDTGFDFATRAMIASTSTHSSLVFHILNSHFMCADNFVATNMIHLPGAHPLRRLMGHLEYGVSQVNDFGMTLLLKEHGAFSIMFNLTNEGRNQFLYDQAKKFQMHEVFSFRQRLQKLGLMSQDRKEDNLTFAPILEDMVEWWDVVSDYVEKYIKVYFPTSKSLVDDERTCTWYNELGKVLRGATKYKNLSDAPDAFVEIHDAVSSVMFGSVVFHQVAGGFAYRSTNPFVVSINWRNGKTLSECVSPVYNAFRTRNICLVTTAHSPMWCQDWSYMVVPPSKDNQEEKVKSDQAIKICKELLASQQSVDEHITQRNTTRRYPLKSLQTNNLECSVAV